MNDFFVDYNIVDASDIVGTRKCLMKKRNIKDCLNLLNKLLLRY